MSRKKLFIGLLGALLFGTGVTTMCSGTPDCVWVEPDGEPCDGELDEPCGCVDEEDNSIVVVPFGYDDDGLHRPVVPIKSTWSVVPRQSARPVAPPRQSAGPVAPKQPAQPAPRPASTGRR